MDEEDDGEIDWLVLDTQTPFERWPAVWFAITELTAAGLVLWAVWYFEIYARFSALVDRWLGL